MKTVILGGAKTLPVMLEEGELRELTVAYASCRMAPGVVGTKVGDGRRGLGPRRGRCQRILGEG